MHHQWGMASGAIAYPIPPAPIYPWADGICCVCGQNRDDDWVYCRKCSAPVHLTCLGDSNLLWCRICVNNRSCSQEDEGSNSPTGTCGGATVNDISGTSHRHTMQRPQLEKMMMLLLLLLMMFFMFLNCWPIFLSAHH